MAAPFAPVDARGLSCPQPVMLTRAALRAAAGNPVVVLLDSMTQVENCTRAAAQLGWTAAAEQKGGLFELTLRQ
jgi:tRNA 2-thiouridine synthesizing protein A